MRMRKNHCGNGENAEDQSDNKVQSDDVLDEVGVDRGEVGLGIFYKDNRQKYGFGVF